MAHISTIGDGLNIALVCDYTSHHHWLAFASWYSFSKIMPDAKFHIFCSRNWMKLKLFEWTHRCQVPLHFHSVGQERDFFLGSLPTPLLVLEPEVVCVREPTDDFVNKMMAVGRSETDKVWVINDWQAKVESGDWCCDCHEEKFCPFVAYPNGFGNFVMSSWINKVSCPFQRAGAYAASEMTFNEAKILHLWKQLTPLFLATARG